METIKQVFSRSMLVLLSYIIILAFFFMVFEFVKEGNYIFFIYADIFISFIIISALIFKRGKSKITKF